MPKNFTVNVLIYYLSTWQAANSITSSGNQLLKFNIFVFGFWLNYNVNFGVSVKTLVHHYKKACPPLSLGLILARGLIHCFLLTLKSLCVCVSLYPEPVPNSASQMSLAHITCKQSRDGAGWRVTAQHGLLFLVRTLNDSKHQLSSSSEKHTGSSRTYEGRALFYLHKELLKCCLIEICYSYFSK